MARNAKQARPHRTRWIALGAGVIVVVVLPVVAGGRSHPTKRDTNSEAATTAGTGHQVTLESIDGQTVSLPAGKPGAMYFSSSTCSSCIPPARGLGELKRRFGTQIDAVFISIDPSDSADGLRAVSRTVGDPPYPFVIDRNGVATTKYRITALGALVVYNANGAVVDRLIDPDRSQIASALRKAGAS